MDPISDLTSTESESFDSRRPLRLSNAREVSGFAVVAVLTLALGIAANSTIFSWISATLLNPIPGLTHTSNLVSVMRGERTDHPSPPFSYLDYQDLRDRNQSFGGCWRTTMTSCRLREPASRSAFMAP